MKKYLFWVCLALTTFLFACKGGIKNVFNKDKTTVTDTRYHNTDGNFMIAFPDTPTITKEVIPTMAGDMVMNMFIYEASKEKIFMVEYSDYPPGIFVKGAEQTTLENAKNGALESFGKCVVEEEKMVNKNEHAGVYFKAKSAENFFVIYHLYLVGNRLYQIGMLQDKAYPSKEEEDMFFNSFDFIKKM